MRGEALVAKGKDLVHWQKKNQTKKKHLKLEWKNSQMAKWRRMSTPKGKVIKSPKLPNDSPKAFRLPKGEGFKKFRLFLPIPKIG